LIQNTWQGKKHKITYPKSALQIRFPPKILLNSHLFSPFRFYMNFLFFCMYCDGVFFNFFLAFAQIARFILNTCLYIGIYVLQLPLGKREGAEKG